MEKMVPVRVSPAKASCNRTMAPFPGTAEFWISVPQALIDLIMSLPKPDGQTFLPLVIHPEIRPTEQMETRHD